VRVERSDRCARFLRPLARDRIRSGGATLHHERRAGVVERPVDGLLVAPVAGAGDDDGAHRQAHQMHKPASSSQKYPTRTLIRFLQISTCNVKNVVSSSLVITHPQQTADDITDRK